jgi:4-amino-4-deoxy-L-arabinose transferase-like glycosyltransferase
VTAQRAVLACLFAAASVLRVHNAWVTPPLAGFDGPYHAAYIGIIHLEGRWPLSQESWSTFHPPLYYALSAALWGLLPDRFGPHAVLFCLRMLNVAAGLAIGFAVHASARLLFPQRPWVAVQAAGLALFLPMLIGPSSELGNEVLTASLCALAVPAWLRCLAQPASRWRALALGVLLGLAVLSKLNAVAVVAAAGLTLLARGFQTRGARLAALEVPALFAVAVLLVSGVYFARNLAYYGKPFLTEVALSAQVMKPSGYGQPRGIASYLRLTPDVLLDPTDRSPRVEGAVWPITFASVWFDIHGSVIRVQSPWGLRFARILFGFGAAISALALLGFAAMLTRRAAPAVPLGAAALVALALLSLASYVAFTRQVATLSTLKGTLLAPGVTAFAIAAGLGGDLLARRGRLAARALALLGAGFVLAVCAIFWVGWLAPTGVTPAVFALQAYSDEPTRRVARYFIWGQPLETRGNPIPGGPDPAPRAPAP